MVLSRRDLVRLALALPFVTAGPAAAQHHQSQHGGQHGSQHDAQHNAPQDHARVFVIGYVAKPGEYHYQDAMTVADAINAAGGLTRQISGIQIKRTVNGELTTLDASLPDAVLAGDTISAR